MANQNPFYVQPAEVPLGLLQDIGKSVDKRRKAATEREQQEQQRMRDQEMRAGLAQVMKTNDPDAIADYIIKNPGAQKIAAGAAGLQSKLEIMEAVRDVERIVIEGEDPAKVAMEGAQKKLRAGGDATSEIRAAEEAVNNKEAMKEKALSTLAVLAPQRYRAYMESIGKDSSELKIGSQVILEDTGTIVQSTAKGPRVYSVTGKRLKGQAAKDAIEEAREMKISTARRMAGEKRKAALEEELNLKGKVAADIINKTNAAKISKDAYERTEPIRKNIANLNEGIRLLREEGAQTGVIDRYLPNLKAATIKFNNLQKQLGLDVIGQTTFGALSKDELLFALDAAVPAGLQPKELASFLEKKKNYQEKLLDYFEASAMYLGTPGNTVTGWIEKKQAEQAKRKQAPKYEEGDTAGGGRLIFKGGVWRDNI